MSGNNTDRKNETKMANEKIYALTVSLKADPDFSGEETIAFIRECHEIADLSYDEVQGAIDEAAASLEGY